MSDSPEQGDISEPNDGDVLARLPKGAADHELHPPAPASQHQRSAQPTNAEPLARPRGALVAMRKSGGLRFSWRLIVVHRDGRIIYKTNAIGAPAQPQILGRLTADQLAELQSLIDQADFATQSHSAARQNPDAFAYELIARVGRKNISAEAFEGSLPEALKPLVHRLNQLLPAPGPAKPDPNQTH